MLWDTCRLVRWHQHVQTHGDQTLACGKHCWRPTSTTKSSSSSNRARSSNRAPSSSPNCAAAAGTTELLLVQVQHQQQLVVAEGQAGAVGAAVPSMEAMAAAAAEITPASLTSNGCEAVVVVANNNRPIHSQTGYNTANSSIQAEFGLLMLLLIGH